MKSYHFPFFLEWTILFAAAKMIDDHFINEFGTESKKKSYILAINKARKCSTL